MNCGKPTLVALAEQYSLSPPRRGKAPADPIARFWSFVDIGPRDQCWLWTGWKTESGYGRFQLTRTTHGRAHRLSLELRLGRRLRDGYLACHKCSNRACVNPRHLYEGTHAQNAADAKRENQPRRGERVNSSILTTEQVRQIRARISSGETCSHLAECFGVNRSTISAIKLRTNWRHV